MRGTLNNKCLMNMNILTPALSRREREFFRNLLEQGGLCRGEHGTITFVIGCHNRRRGVVLVSYEIGGAPRCRNASTAQPLPCRHGEIPQERL